MQSRTQSFSSLLKVCCLQLPKLSSPPSDLFRIIWTEGSALTPVYNVKKENVEGGSMYTVGPKRRLHLCPHSGSKEQPSFFTVIPSPPPQRYRSPVRP